jgi:hypothetical protein
VPANLAFTAVPIPAGKHRIEWEEHLPGWKATRFGPVLFAIIVAGALVFGRGSRSVG